jgi:hypothetical protein
MNSIKDLIDDTAVHERKIEMRTYPMKDDRLIVEGWLRDERLVPGYNWDGRPRSPGVVHWMCVRLLVGGWPLTILDAEAEMRTVPNELCPTTAESVKRLIGLPIVSGFSGKVRKRLGGIRGCSHLLHLVLSMGPAALHGCWSQRSRAPRPLPGSLDEFPELTALVNSCKLWREDGPLINMRQEFLERRKNGR